MATSFLPLTDFTGLLPLLKGEWEGNSESAVAWKVVRRYALGVVALRFVMVALETGMTMLVQRRWGGSGLGGLAFLWGGLGTCVSVLGFLVMAAFPFVTVPRAWVVAPGPKAPGERVLGILAAMVVAGLCIGVAMFPTMLAAQLASWMLDDLRGTGPSVPGSMVVIGLARGLLWSLLEAVGLAFYCGAIALRLGVRQSVAGARLAVVPVVAWFGGVFWMCGSGQWFFLARLLPMAGGSLGWGGQIVASILTQAVGSMVLCVAMMSFWQHDLDLVRSEMMGGKEGPEGSSAS